MFLRRNMQHRCLPRSLNDGPMPGPGSRQHRATSAAFTERNERINPMSASTTAGRTAAPPPRMQGALFLPIGDEGRAELVERRISEAITGGHLRAGERLPAEQDLARTLGVAPVTVREALGVLRERGLIVTRRGRNGGSFVAEGADPLVFARQAVQSSSRLALRDLGVHYAAITVGAVRLAARRADPIEAQALITRIDRADETDLGSWRRTLDDVQVELVALSQSARLTREQMKLQSELSPYLRLIDGNPQSRLALRGHLRDAAVAVIDANEAAAATAIEEFVTRAIRDLVVMQSES